MKFSVTFIGGTLGGLPGDVAEDLHDGGDQGLFFCKRICSYLS
jgi:hypothetical protein